MLNTSFDELIAFTLCMKTHLSLVQPRLNLAAAISGHKDDWVDPRLGSWRIAWRLDLPDLRLEAWSAANSLLLSLNFTLNSKAERDSQKREEKKKFGREVHCEPPGKASSLTHSSRKVGFPFLRIHQSRAEEGGMSVV